MASALKVTMTIEELEAASTVIASLLKIPIQEGKWSATKAWQARLLKKAVASHLEEYFETVKQLRESTGLDKMLEPIEKFIAENGEQLADGRKTITPDSPHYPAFLDLYQAVFTDEVKEAERLFNTGNKELRSQSVELVVSKFKLKDLEYCSGLTGNDLEKFEKFLIA